MKHLLFLMLLVTCACSSPKGDGSENQAADSVTDKSASPGDQVVGKKIAWRAVERLPEVKLPFQFDYAHGAGVEMTADSLLYNVLSGKTTRPVVKRVVGRVHDDENASVQHVFWIGKQTPEADFWRAYVTSFFSDYDGGKVNYSQELDASQEDFESCMPKIREHWTAINSHQEIRSFINMTSCTGDNVEVVRTYALGVNEISETDNAHPFLNFPIMLPVSSVPEPTDALNYYMQGQFDDDAKSVFFKERTTEVPIYRIQTLPLEMDGRVLFGVTRSGLWEEHRYWQEAQLSIVAGEKVGNQYRVGKAATDSYDHEEPGKTIGEIPEFQVMHDHFLRIHATYKHTDKEYTHWIVRQGYDLYYLEDLSYEMLRVEKNYVFARYGYIFQSSELADYFGQFPWYKPTSRKVDDQLTADDMELIKDIRYLEERR